MIARQEKARAHLSDNFIVEVRSAMSQVEGMKHSRLYTVLYTQETVYKAKWI